MPPAIDGSSRGDPLVDRFNPAVRKHRFVLERSVAFDEFARVLRDHWHLDEARWQRMLWHGGLHVDRRRLQAATLPATIDPSPAVIGYEFVAEPERVPVTAAMVLLDHADVVVVNKPAWVPVQGSRASIQISLETELRRLLGAAWLTPVHRLDRMTSGLIIFARSPEATERVASQFRAQTVYKRYRVLAEGAPRAEQFVVHGYLARAFHPSHAFFALTEQACPDGRYSETTFRVRRTLGRFTELDAVLGTGRTHQIRVHLAHVGLPVLGDGLYGSAAVLPRLMLHAEELRLVFETGGPRHTCELPPGPDFGLP